MRNIKANFVCLKAGVLMSIFFMISTPAFINVVDADLHQDMSSTISGWSQFHQNSCRTGYTGEPGPVPETQYSYKTFGEIVGSPAIYKGLVFYGTTGWMSQGTAIYQGGRLECRRASNLAYLWHYQCGDPNDPPSVISSPAVRWNKVYFGTSKYGQGQVISLGIKNGDPVWIRTFPGETFTSSPTLTSISGGDSHPNRVYICSYGQNNGYGKLYCLDAETGNTIFSYETPSGIAGGPALWNSRIYFITLGNDEEHATAYCVNYRYGNLLWTRYLGGLSYSTPAITYGRLFIQTGFGLWDHEAGSFHVYETHWCLDAYNGDIEWFESIDSFLSSSPLVSGSSPAVADDRVYFGSSNGKLWSRDAYDGEMCWTLQTGNMIDSSPAVAQEKIYVGSNDGKLYCINRDASGLAVGNLGDDVKSSPAVAGGFVYIGSSINTNIPSADWHGKIYKLRNNQYAGLEPPESRGISIQRR